MKRLGRLCPSPAMAVAMVALFAALGGTSYAVISSSTVPDSLGVFHACVNRSSGAIRIVTKPSACQKAVKHGKHKTLGELAVAWSQTGPAGNPGVQGNPGAQGLPGAAGSNVVLRARATSTQTANYSAGQVVYPLTSTSWTQGANEVDQILGAVTITTAQGVSGCMPTSGVEFFLYVDSTLLGSFFADQNTWGAQSVQTVPVPATLDYLFEPGVATAHVLTVKVQGDCPGTTNPQAATVDSVSIDIVAHS
jgi:hypothetical protein